ncbi:EF-Tu/IF-2/RF-3 family GTPase [Mycolicibacterium sp. J2]|uniref:EF-Tu/IF-2/RF-3 family GTPase n=1 Tax=Mycolicibacterium sp. J2 TaxID=2993511 RepID=UPI00224A733E|nr:EF-Tu/IF-2/RF-3 family GTPase [Mycolicibacterium sp. J2]MCX2711492.1 EF-Tu/IF-2/RF-3 family GTPase [Mycolicibacterium sp. J2]
MRIDAVFMIKRRGVVVTGRVDAGEVRVGDTLWVADRTFRVDGIEAFRKSLDSASAGDTIGLLFRTAEKTDFRAGSVLRDSPSDGAQAPATFVL